MTRTCHDAIRVLFVDDEQSVLDGIARIQRRLKPNWIATYVNSPAMAMKMLTDRTVVHDVVVTDINMPGISGLKILECVVRSCPAAGRIALSGQLDITSMLGIHKFADCQICKPVDLDILFEKVCEVYLSHGT